MKYLKDPKCGQVTQVMFSKIIVAYHRLRFQGQKVSNLWQSRQLMADSTVEKILIVTFFRKQNEKIV